MKYGCFSMLHNTVMLIWFTVRVSHFLNLLEYELRKCCHRWILNQAKWDLTTRCCRQRLRNQGCPRWSASAWRPSPRCPPCAWWSPPSDWFALQVKNIQQVCSLRWGRRVLGVTAGSPSALSSFLSLCRSVRNRLLTSVDLPRPDSPGTQRQHKIKHLSSLILLWLKCHIWVDSSKNSLIAL